jgi:hypothetical protein
VDIIANTELHPRLGAEMGFIVFKQKLSTLVRAGEGVGVTLMLPVDTVVGVVLPNKTSWYAAPVGEKVGVVGEFVGAVGLRVGEEVGG